MLTLAYLRPEEDQSIWSKRQQGFQPCCEAGIGEPTLSHVVVVTVTYTGGLFLSPTGTDTLRAQVVGAAIL